MQEPQESCRAVSGATGMQGTIGMVFTTLLLAGLMILAAATDARIAGAQEPPDGTVEVTYDTAEIEMVSLINGYREENGLDPLLVSETASLAAKRHSEDMARYGFVDHATQQSAYFEPGASFDERMDTSVYDHDTKRSENIAAGGDAEEAFEGWRESPSHDENMLDPDMKVIGIGLATSGDSGEGRYSSYWTTDFGGHVDETATGPSEVELGPEATATDNEPRTDPGTGGAGGDSNDDSSSGSDETADESVADDQYSSGDEESVTEVTEGDEETSVDRQTTEDTDEEPAESDSKAPEDSAEGRSGGSGEEGDKDCDTRADFDKGPFDEGFGSALSEHIRAKVDCQLAQAGIGTGGNGGEEREGEDGATTGRAGSTTISESTIAQSSTNEEAEKTGGSASGDSEDGDSEDGDGEGGSTPDQTGDQEADSGGFLAGLFGGDGSAEKSQASSDELSDDSGVSSSDEPAGEGSLEDESSNESSSEPANESSDPEPTDGSRDGASSVLGPASTDDDTGEAR